VVVIMMMIICIQLYITAVWPLFGQVSRKTLAAGSRSYFVGVGGAGGDWYLRNKELPPLFFFNFTLWPTNAQLFHKLSHSYMFRHYRVILRGLVINTLPSYISITNAAVGNTIYN
jgi:hypothetical protein